MDHFMLSGLFAWVLIKSNLLEWRLNARILLLSSGIGLLPDVASYLLSLQTFTLLSSAQTHIHRQNSSHSLLIFILGITMAGMIVEEIVAYHFHGICRRALRIGGIRAPVLSELDVIRSFFVLLAILYTGHLLIDMAMGGYGVPLFYPLSTDCYQFVGFGMVIHSPAEVAQLAQATGDPQWAQHALENFLLLQGWVNIVEWALIFLYLAMYLPFTNKMMQTAVSLCMGAGITWIIIVWVAVYGRINLRL